MYRDTMILNDIGLSLFLYIVRLFKLDQTSTGENEVKLMMKHAPEWVRTSDPVIKSPDCYLWIIVPAYS